MAVEFSVPMRLMLDSVFVGVEKGRLLLMLLDQIELLNGVVDHRPLVLPRMELAVWVGELELAGQEGLGSVAGESQR